MGAGAVGCAVAWAAAREGLAGEVVLVDPDPGSGASRVAGGMLAPISEAWPGEREVLELGAASLAAWPSFAAAVARDAGCSVGLRREGTLQVAVDAADVEDLDRVAEHLRAWGRVVERLSGRAVRRLEPSLGPSVRAGLAIPDDLAVDNRVLLGALSRAGASRGVVVSRRSVARVVDDGERVTGVAFADGGELEASRVVVAAGAWSAGLHPVLAGRVRPVKGEILRVRARRSSLPPPSRTVRASVSGRPVYAVPRDGGGLVVGATQYEAGFDADVLVGGVRDLVADVERVLPGIADYALEESAASFRPGTDDNLPLLGPVGPVGPAGLVAATGHGRNGMLLVAVTVSALVAVLRGEPLPEEARAAAADRSAVARG
ncbi:glycine oxidase ThiO [Actinomycetospora flava]|uniref:glycine oxidase n=1 Tax=Actinomycetospora flava TaxID=3129232 RepID=A0ABU8M1C1_9PSEU